MTVQICWHIAYATEIASMRAVLAIVSQLSGVATSVIGAVNTAAVYGQSRWFCSVGALGRSECLVTKC
jgi:hypothetical protein